VCFQQQIKSTCRRANAAQDLRTAALLRSIATNLPTSAPLHTVHIFMSIQRIISIPKLTSKSTISSLKNLVLDTDGCLSNSVT
jgi:hypothetical protein